MVPLRKQIHTQLKWKGKNVRDMVETVVFGSNADMKNRNAIQIEISWI